MKSVMTAWPVLHHRIIQLFYSPCGIQHLGQLVWLTGAWVLHVLCLTFKHGFLRHFPSNWTVGEKRCAGKRVRQCSRFSHTSMCESYFMTMRVKDTWGLSAAACAAACAESGGAGCKPLGKGAPVDTSGCMWGLAVRLTGVEDVQAIVRLFQTCRQEKHQSRTHPP